MGEPEEEIFGSVYDNGTPITSTNYYVALEELGTPSKAYESQMWVNPSEYAGGWMYGWFDTHPDDVDGPCRDPRDYVGGRYEHDSDQLRDAAERFIP